MTKPDAANMVYQILGHGSFDLKVDGKRYRIVTGVENTLYHIEAAGSSWDYAVRNLRSILEKRDLVLHMLLAVSINK